MSLGGELLAGDAVEVGVEAEVLLAGEVGVQGGVLEDQADVPSDLVPVLDDVIARDPGGPRGGVREGAQDLDRGGLARAVRAEETEGLPGRHGEVDAAHRLDLAVPLDQVGDLDDGLAHAPASGASSTAVVSVAVACRWPWCRWPSAVSVSAAGSVADVPVGSSSARIRYIERRVCASTARAWVSCSGEPARRTSITAIMTWRTRSPSSIASSSVIPATASHEPLQLVGVLVRVGPARVGERVHPAAALALGGDQALVLELLQGRVDRPRARPPHAAGAPGDLLDQLVAVPLTALVEQVEDGRADIALARPRAPAERVPVEHRLPVEHPRKPAARSARTHRAESGAERAASSAVAAVAALAAFPSLAALTAVAALRPRSPPRRPGPRPDPGPHSGRPGRCGPQSPSRIPCL